VLIAQSRAETLVLVPADRATLPYDLELIDARG
jgi:hypothetical protein